MKVRILSIVVVLATAVGLIYYSQVKTEQDDAGAGVGPPDIPIAAELNSDANNAPLPQPVVQLSPDPSAVRSKEKAPGPDSPAPIFGEPAVLGTAEYLGITDKATATIARFQEIGFDIVRSRILTVDWEVLEGLISTDEIDTGVAVARIPIFEDVPCQLVILLESRIDDVRILSGRCLDGRYSKMVSMNINPDTRILNAQVTHGNTQYYAKSIADKYVVAFETHDSTPID